MSNTASHQIGAVRLYKDDRGFGFLKCDQGGMPDIFVHASAVKAAGLARLEVGQRLAFDLEVDHKGHKATNLRLIEV
jgi:CspA family cold shock protein